MSVYLADCNVWVSALIWGGLPRRALENISSSDEIGISIAIYDEIIEVLGRPKFAEAAGEARNRLALMLLDAKWVEPEETITDCADPDDNIYLECALAAQASAILTGDKHLLKLHPWRGISIIRVADFLAQTRDPNQTATG